MRVGVERLLHARVAELAGDVDDVLALRDQDARVNVPEIVKPQAQLSVRVEPGALDRRFEATLGDVPPVERRADLRREDVVGRLRVAASERLGLVLAEHPHERGHDDDRAHGARRLRLYALARRNLALRVEAVLQRPCVPRLRRDKRLDVALRVRHRAHRAAAVGLSAPLCKHFADDRAVGIRRLHASTKKAPFPAPSRMGGTGLEPVTPSLSSWCSPN